MPLLLWSLLLWTASQAAAETINNASKPLFMDSGHGVGLFLADADCPGLSLCSPPLSSKSKVLPKWDELNCQCDDACATYGDCCVNALAYDAEQTRMARHHWRCVNLETYQGIYMLASCPATWGDPQTRQLCERRPVEDPTANPRDPIATTPVTNPRTGFTYLNYYCALCNEDDQGAIFWTPRVECGELASYNSTFGNVSADFVWSQLRYDEASRGWGVPLTSYNITRYSPNQTLVSGFATCNVLVQMPVTVGDLVRQCRPWMDDCPASWSNATVRHQCHSYTAAVYRSPEVTYRNAHCAMCNEEDPGLLNCHNILFYRNMNPAVFAPSFAFLFDINEASGNVVGVTQRCGHGEIYDPFFKMCRQMVCANARYKMRLGKCVLVEAPETSTTIMTTTTTVVTTNVTVATSSFTLVPPFNVTTLSSQPNETGTDAPDNASAAPTTTTVTELSATDCVRFNISQVLYQLFANGSIYIEKYHRMYSAKDYVASDDGSILVCIPIGEHETTTYLYDRKFSVVLAYLTLAGLGISLTCIVIHLVAFMMVPSLRNLSGKNLASLCVSLIGAYVTFIISQFDNLVSKEACTAIAVILYYCFLASFFWMNCIAFDVWRTLRLATSELRVSSGQQWSKFVAYSAYSWFGPAIIVAVSIVVENSSVVPPIFRPFFGAVTCWFGSRRALLIFFVTPVVTIVLLNVFMFGLSAHIIISASQPASSQQPGNKARRNFRLYLRLALIMGLTWIFGILAGQVDREPLWYIFIILNTLQGLFIFLSFTCTDKVWAYLRDRVFLKKGSYYSTSRGAQARKFELEGRDSGSGESQSSQTSHLSFTRTSQVSRTNSNKKF